MKREEDLHKPSGITSGSVRKTSARIVEITEEYEGYLDILFEETEIARRALPGQFVLLRGWESMEPILPRPFDIMDTDPERGLVRILVKVSGRGTGLLRLLSPGRTIDVTGPLGTGIREISGSSIGFLVRGVGSAAVTLLAREAGKCGIRTHTFQSASTASRLVGREYLEKLSDEYYIATDDGSEGYHGDARDVVERVTGEKQIANFYTCGSRRFARFIKSLDQRQVTKGYVFLEGFMACGLGYCHGCAVKKEKEEGYFLVCTDGPVFPVSEVVLE